MGMSFCNGILPPSTLKHPVSVDPQILNQLECRLRDDRPSLIQGRARLDREPTCSTTNTLYRPK